MAKKSQKDKKKGPKGKKARAKAKLERQWGEKDIQDRGVSSIRGQDRERSTSAHATPYVSNQVKQFPEESFENFRPTVEHSDEEDENSVKAVSSFVDILRRKHRKNNRLAQPDQPSQEVEKVEDGENDEETESDSEDFSQIEQIDPFTARFSLSEEDVSNRNLLAPSRDASRRIPLSFVREGMSLHLSKWPPIDVLPDSIPESRKEWKQLMRRLWASQKPLLRVNPPKTAVAQVLYPAMATYMDICQTIPQKEEATERIYASHILNHIWTSRQRIYRHTKEWNRLDDEDDLEGKQDPRFRDQGFTRPTVLVLMPTRGVCFRFIKTLQSMLHNDDDDVGGGTENSASGLSERFVTEYGPPEKPDSDPQREAVLEKKGDEWNALFGDDVNDDDDFKLGVAIHLHEKRRPMLKLYTEFSKSDLIVASPLGLKMLAAKRLGENENDNKDSAVNMEIDAVAPDYLSSIEICWLSHAHVLMMQNWDHVVDVLAWLNQRPKETKNTDFARVRPYFLEDGVSSGAWRQLMLTAPYLDPCMKAAFGRYAVSRSGTARLSQKTMWTEAAMTRIAIPTKTVFQRLTVASVQEQADARLDYFSKHILPKIENDQQPFTLIFVPSYLEFVSLRNLLLKREANYFVSVTEYARHTEVSRGRARFSQGRKSIMLYTGRAHFYYRHSIRGVRHIIWYGLPVDPIVFQEVVDWCQDERAQSQESLATHESSVLALYSAYEAHALERIVGHSHCSRMTKGTKTTFLFAA